MHQVAAARVAPPHAHLHGGDVVGPGQELEEDVVPAAVVERAVHVVHPLRRRQEVVHRTCRVGRCPRRRLRHRRQRPPPQFVELRHGPTLSPASGSRQAPCGCGSPPCAASLPQSQLPQGLTPVQAQHASDLHPRRIPADAQGQRAAEITREPRQAARAALVDAVCISPAMKSFPAGWRRAVGVVATTAATSRLGATGGLVRACRRALRGLSGGRRHPWAGSSSAGRSPRRAVAAGPDCSGPASPPASPRSPSA